jgi:ribosomal protein L40E
MIPVPSADDWICAVCGARHETPSPTCRRCGSALLMFARLRAAARALRAAGHAAEADALTEPR